MLINKLDDSVKYNTLLPIDNNGREINIYSLTNVMVTGESIHYPNTLLYDVGGNELYNPINEKTMSIGDVIIDDFDLIVKNQDKTEDYSVFFFIYNMDNYYHFVYDSLPYLISFNKLKLHVPDIKLLMYYPPGKDHFYKFVTEFLSIIGITDDEIVIADESTLYKEILISTSYTHDFDSNLPPRDEIYEFYQNIVDKVKIDMDDTPKNIYISRRSWLHGDMSNIGTNYTNRRKLLNEDELVEFLVSKGYEEIFTETLTTEQKIVLFKNAENIIGSIGGGICNVLFSKPNCKLTALVSPYFLDVNKRFIYSLNKVDLTLFEDSKNTNDGYFKKYMRVKYGDIIGEIIDINGDNITISYSDTRITGWNSENKYKTITLKSKNCIRLDKGLNSSWEINLKKFKKNYD